MCGEGGEYETITLDCPLFTHGSIVLEDWRIELHSPGGCDAVGNLHPRQFSVQPKNTLAEPHVEAGLESSAGRMPVKGQPVLAKGDQPRIVVKSGAQVITVPNDFKAEKGGHISLSRSSQIDSQGCKVALRESAGFIVAIGEADRPATPSHHRAFADTAFRSVLTLLTQGKAQNFLPRHFSDKFITQPCARPPR